MFMIIKMKKIYNRIKSTLLGFLVVGILSGLLYLIFVAGMNGYLHHPCLNQEIDTMICWSPFSI